MKVHAPKNQMAARNLKIPLVDDRRRPTFVDLRRALQRSSDAARARGAARFFKTAPGQYGAGDRFIGVTVPQLRKLAKSFCNLPRPDLAPLLKSAIHEERTVALLILVLQMHAAARADDALAEKNLFDFYLLHLHRVNNWDLVDCSAEHIVGGYLFRRKNDLLLNRLGRSGDLWHRRIAIVATFYFLRRGRYQPTLRLAEMLLDDREDLIHKAVGWLLREIGKRDRARLERFLRRYCRRMPRTMLRYAIERFPEVQRQKYLRAGRMKA